LEKNNDDATWYFAENQLEVTENCQYTFGWGSSGYKISGEYISDINDLTGKYSNYDWGVYNSIYNGGKQSQLWRTPSIYEWRYIINNRPNATKLRAFIAIEDINGLILLPDDWHTPDVVKHIVSDIGFTTTSISKYEWEILESFGAVFFRHMGIDYGYGYDAYGGLDGIRKNTTGYWSSSGYYSGGLYDDFRGAYVIGFTPDGNIYFDGTHMDVKPMHVRLLKDM